MMLLETIVTRGRTVYNTLACANGIVLSFDWWSLDFVVYPIPIQMQRVHILSAAAKHSAELALTITFQIP